MIFLLLLPRCVYPKGWWKQERQIRSCIYYSIDQHERRDLNSLCWSHNGFDFLFLSWSKDFLSSSLRISFISVLFSIHRMKLDTLHLFHWRVSNMYTYEFYAIDSILWRKNETCHCRLKLNSIMVIREQSIHANWSKTKIGLLQGQMIIQLVYGILIVESKFICINSIMIWQIYRPYEWINRALGIAAILIALINSQWLQFSLFILVYIHVAGIRPFVVSMLKQANKLYINMFLLFYSENNQLFIP